MNNKKENNSEVGKYAYEVARMERVQVETEGGFAASQGVTGNSQSGVALDDWAKADGMDSDTWSDQ